MAHVVTCFLRHRGEVLLVRRSDDVGTYTGQWGGVSGYVEDETPDPLADARRELREETGIDDATLVRCGDSLTVSDAEGEFTVHPFLFDAPTREVTPNYELADWEWVAPPLIRERDTVPRLWETYRRVAPTVETVRSDTTHGSATLSVRALEALRDASAEADDWDAVADVGQELRESRPAMAAIANRVNRVLATSERDPAVVTDAAHDAIADALDADDEAGRAAAELIDGPVLTLSRSGTVRATLGRLDVPVVVGESRPKREGVDVAESLADGREVTLAVDAALPHLLAEGVADAVVVGADAVLADGSVSNKVGTRSCALAAAREEVPVYVVAARDKVRPDEVWHGESGDPSEVYDGEGDVSVATPVFDRTPADLITAVVTETGPLDGDGVREVASEHREHARWDTE